MKAFVIAFFLLIACAAKDNTGLADLDVIFHADAKRLGYVQCPPELGFKPGQLCSPTTMAEFRSPQPGRLKMWTMHTADARAYQDWLVFLVSGGFECRVGRECRAEPRCRMVRYDAPKTTCEMQQANGCPPGSFIAKSEGGCVLYDNAGIKCCRPRGDDGLKMCDCVVTERSKP